MKFLKKENIATQIHYKPIYKHSVYKKYILINDCKNSNNFYRQQLTLPLHTLMNKKDVNYIVSKLKNFFYSKKSINVK